MGDCLENMGNVLRNRKTENAGEAMPLVDGGAGGGIPLAPLDGNVGAIYGAIPSRPAMTTASSSLQMEAVVGGTVPVPDDDVDVEVEVAGVRTFPAPIRRTDIEPNPTTPSGQSMARNGVETSGQVPGQRPDVYQGLSLLEQCAAWGLCPDLCPRLSAGSKRVMNIILSIGSALGVAFYGIVSASTWLGRVVHGIAGFLAVRIWVTVENIFVLLNRTRQEQEEGFRLMNERFDAVDKRFDAADERFDAVDERIDELLEAEDNDTATSSEGNEADSVIGSDCGDGGNSSEALDTIV